MNRYFLVNKNTGKTIGNNLTSREQARIMKRRQKKPLNWRIVDASTGRAIR